MPVSFDLEQIERDHRAGAEATFATALERASSDDLRTAIRLQQAMLEASITETKVMIAAAGNDVAPHVIGCGLGCSVGSAIATILGSLSDDEASHLMAGFARGLEGACNAVHDPKYIVATATGTPGGRA